MVSRKDHNVIQGSHKTQNGAMMLDCHPPRQVEISPTA